MGLHKSNLQYAKKTVDITNNTVSAKQYITNPRLNICQLNLHWSKNTILTTNCQLLVTSVRYKTGYKTDKTDIMN